MARMPENINFCIFVDCHYLDGEECTVEECGFSKKLVNWWEWAMLRNRFVRSLPPTGKKAVKNIYWDPELEKVTIEKEG